MQRDRIPWLRGPQWQSWTVGARCASITGATSTSYRVIETGKGSRLRALITATNPIRSSTAPLGPAA